MAVALIVALAASQEAFRYLEEDNLEDIEPEAELEPIVNHEDL